MKKQRKETRLKRKRLKAAYNTISVSYTHLCKTIRAMLNKSNSVQVEMKDPGSIGTLTIGDCTYNVYLGNTTLNKLRCLPDKDVYKRVFTLIEA